MFLDIRDKNFAWSLGSRVERYLAVVDGLDRVSTLLRSPNSRSYFGTTLFSLGSLPEDCVTFWSKVAGI